MGPSTIPNVYGAHWFISLIDATLGLHGSFFLYKNMMLVLLYLISTKWFKTNLGSNKKL